MTIIDFMKTQNGKIIVSVILALGLASLLRLSCKNANMVIITGPPMEQTKDKIFNFDNKCYSYKTVTTSCKNLENNKTNLL
jgi:hypothetical protein